MTLRCRSILTLVCASSLLLFCQCGGEKNESAPEIRHPQDFMVTDVSGWTMDEGKLETATTIDELRDSEGVDGGSYPFELHNFQEWAGTTYSGTIQGVVTSLTVWIFEMQTVTDASELYDDSENGIAPPTSEPPVQPIGNESRIWQDGLFTTALDFRRDNYWVKLSIWNQSDDAEQVLQLFGTSIDQKITE